MMMMAPAWWRFLLAPTRPWACPWRQRRQRQRPPSPSRRPHSPNSNPPATQPQVSPLRAHRRLSLPLPLPPFLFPCPSNSARHSSRCVGARDRQSARRTARRSRCSSSIRHRRSRSSPSSN
ncbi:hypothetical protein HDK77DRAFT_456402 [Phyllosticta capitalensis]|uniref:uncharacterized protein n=1 Tax=Phyllosticta capitalensis TaxID=121624 RepID=UPI00312F668F